MDDSVVRTYLILNEELHTLDGSGGGLRDCGSNTTHCEGRHVSARKYPSMLATTPFATNGSKKYPIAAIE
jgi:hypothetical protein